jgi:hypothetical protein
VLPATSFTPLIETETPVAVGRFADGRNSATRVLDEYVIAPAIIAPPVVLTEKFVEVRVD